jgi:4-diphosphocytidyl-2C-methyl-D-erythritol 2-phosphate synthase
MNEIAYAKINLALHVRRRRADGYHELETVFAFVDDGDRLEVTPAAEDSLVSYGEFAANIDDPFGNIAAKAMGQLPRSDAWAVKLDKRLPVAAGLGGGSADAGAIFRLVERTQGLPEDWLRRAGALGADVPACVLSKACVGRGTGTELEQVADNDLQGCPVLLVNPRLAMPTGPVFKAWDEGDRGGLPSGSLRDIALAGRNDLEPGALTICPPIAEVLAALQGNDAFLARMSGSGATCFALYDDEASRDAAAGRVAEVQPQWWQMRGRLR